MRTYIIKNTRRYLPLTLCMLVALCVSFLGQINVPKTVAAATVTDYLAKATPYYKHPVTGKIEDPGNNEGLGQSMTESVLYSKALLEETSDGKTYATIRIFLTDNISKVRFWTQKNAKDSWKKASAVIMQENMNGKYCSDYRLQIPDKTAILRMRFYVTPMGRDVVFYIRFSNWKKGSGDFITSGKAEGKNSSAKSDSGKTSVGASDKTSVRTSGKTSAAASVQQNTSNSTKNGTEAKDSSISGQNRSENTDTENLSDDTVQTDSGQNTDTAVDDNATEKNTETGEQLLENAQGLTLSDDSILASSSPEQSETAEQNVNEAGQTSGQSESGTKGQEYTLSISWVLVLQCILIITVPPLCILLVSGYFFHRLRLKEKEWEDD